MLRAAMFARLFSRFSAFFCAFSAFSADFSEQIMILKQNFVIFFFQFSHQIHSNRAIFNDSRALFRRKFYPNCFCAPRRSAHCIAKRQRPAAARYEELGNSPHDGNVSYNMPWPEAGGGGSAYGRCCEGVNLVKVVSIKTCHT